MIETPAASGGAESPFERGSAERSRAEPHIPPTPSNENERQRAVDRTGIVNRGRDRDLQRIVDEAARTFDMPIAALSIIDHARQWFAAITGLEVEETPRSVSFCAHAIHRPGEALIVRDATLDQRFARHPSVVSGPCIRFYAGVPLIDRAGYALGALCISDYRARDELLDIPELVRLARSAERLITR